MTPASSPTGDTAGKPRFGDKVRNPWTQPDNPLHLSTFVRVVHRNGHMNRGTWWEVTDGKGRFWQLKAEDSELIPAVSSSSPDDTAPDGPVSKASGEPYGPGTVVDVIAEELNETVGMTVSWPRISSTAHRAAARLRKLGLLAGPVPVPADGDTEEPKR